MAETGCLKDGHFQNLEIENFLVNNNFFGTDVNTDTFQLTKPASIRTLRNDPSIPVKIPGYAHYNLDPTSLPTTVGSTNATTAGPWQRADQETFASSTCVATADTTAAAGVSYVLTTDNGDGDDADIVANGSDFRCTTAKPWWVECQVKLTEHENEFFFGLAERVLGSRNLHTEPAADGADRIGFGKLAHDADGITAAVCNNTAGSINQALDFNATADNDILTMGIYWDGAGTIRFYGSQTAIADAGAVGDTALLYTNNTSAHHSSDVALTLRFYLQEAGGTNTAANINFIKGTKKL